MSPTPRRAPASFRAVFDDAAFDEDVRHVTAPARRAAAVARHRFERSGVAPNELRPCQADARDGTQLPGCFKTYLPPRQPPQQPGPWRMVFVVGRHPQGLIVQYLAFGVGHPTRPSQPSVYQIAEQRLRRL